MPTDPTSRGRNWRGEPVDPDEPPGVRVLVWEITPSISGDHDSTVIRDYHDAVSYAQDVLDQKVDSAGEADLIKHGVTVAMKLVYMTPAEIAELENENEL